MVEITLGRNIKSAHDKLLLAKNSVDFSKMLGKNEQNLFSLIKKQTVKDGIKAYCLGSYTLFAGRLPMHQSAAEWQQFGAKTYQKIKQCSAIKVCISAPTNAFYDFAFGLELAAYRFDKYRTTLKTEDLPQLEKLILVNTGLTDLENYKPYASLANAVRYARDMINEPANALTPEIFATDIKRLEYLGLKVEILDEKQMRDLGFNLALAVAQGSQNKPRVAVIEWRGNLQNENIELGLVGKGVTFDSGGISIKPAANMGDMKQDMAGAGAVVATMKAAALQKLPHNIAAVVGLVENMPSGSATRPGDVVHSMSGQSVEIDNTDAEGRLVLADCLTYIQKRFNPPKLIDMATLTGAIVVALGHTFAGLFCNNDNFAEMLLKAGNFSGERLWQMPLDKEFDDMLSSNIADMKNVGSRAGGSCSAASFLQRFVDKNRVWAHIDIAGMDLSDGKKPIYPKGASGFGVCLLNEIIKKIKS